MPDSADQSAANDKTPPGYTEVPPTGDDYLTALSGNLYICETAYALPVVPHPQNRSAAAPVTVA